MAHDILAILAEGPRRPVEIRDMLGFSSANYFTAQYLTPMRKAGYIAQVGEANPHSPRLEYKITAKGRREIANGQVTPPLPTPPKGSDPLASLLTGSVPHLPQWHLHIEAIMMYNVHHK